MPGVLDGTGAEYDMRLTRGDLIPFTFVVRRNLTGIPVGLTFKPRSGTPIALTAANGGLLVSVNSPVVGKSSVTIRPLTSTEWNTLLSGVAEYDLQIYAEPNARTLLRGRVTTLKDATYV